jgi:hypothetical protein
MTTHARAILAGALWFTSISTPSGQSATADYCQVGTPGAHVLAMRPAEGEPVVDDVNWFARPVPNPEGRWIVGFASHDQNYLYDLSRGRRIRIPDKSDAVATPDGRYVSVPSHYTSTKTVNFYETKTLLARLDEGRDASDVPPAYAHADADVADVYYQSVGVVSHREEGPTAVTVYRMMFSGSNFKPAPGFRIVDYTFTRSGDRLTVSPTKAMRLCPQITRDLATPFVSKDGRYVVAHDGGREGEPGTLKIFEITGVDPAGQTTTCEMRVDFGFAAGKADFSFDGRRLTFHIAKHDYLIPFVNGGINAPAITDVVVVDLVHDAQGRITGYGGLARLTTSTREGVGSYFPAFFPDGRVFYLANTAPKNSAEPKRFRFAVVDPEREVYIANLFADPRRRDTAAAIGRLWLEACQPGWQPFKAHEAPWAFMSLSRSRCERLVQERWTGDAAGKAAALAACAGGRQTDR